MSRINLGNLIGYDIPAFVRMIVTAQHVVRATWEYEAGRVAKLPSSYLPAIRLGDVITRDGVIIASVELVGTVPNMYEQGMGPGGVGSTPGPYDIRTFVLKPGTKNLHYDSKGLMYVNVPFDHSAKSIKSANVTFNRSPKTIIDMAKRLKPTTSQGGTTQWGGRLESGLASKIAEHHATDPFAGMVRLESAYSVVTQSTFRTWRRMSQGSKPWIHPGVQPRRVADIVVAGSDRIIKDVFGG